MIEPPAVLDPLMQTTTAPPTRHPWQLVRSLHRGRTDHVDRLPPVEQHRADGVDTGSVQVRETVPHGQDDGLDQAPTSLAQLVHGGNTGTTPVRLDPQEVAG